MGGNALVASAQHGVWAVIALQRRAARAGRAFVARFGGVVEVESAGSLQEIATGGGYIAQLGGRATQQGSAQHCIVSAYPGVGCQISVAYCRANTQPALGCNFGSVQPEAIDVDEVYRRFDFQLHQVEQIGSPCNELCAWVGLRRGRGGLG